MKQIQPIKSTPVATATSKTENQNMKLELTMKKITPKTEK